MDWKIVMLQSLTSSRVLGRSAAWKSWTIQGNLSEKIFDTLDNDKKTPKGVNRIYTVRLKRRTQRNTILLVLWLVTSFSVRLYNIDITYKHRDRL